jgi:hypothetical protein
MKAINLIFHGRWGIFDLTTEEQWPCVPGVGHIVTVEAKLNNTSLVPMTGRVVRVEWESIRRNRQNLSPFILIANVYLEEA